MLQEAPQARNKGAPWDETEHRAFLKGLSSLGKGNWRGISRMFVPSRSPTQVASHAQKYFLRVASGGGKRRSRFSGLEGVGAAKQSPATKPAAAAKRKQSPSPAASDASAPNAVGHHSLFTAASSPPPQRAPHSAVPAHAMLPPPFPMLPPMIFALPPGAAPPFPMLPIPPAIAAAWAKAFAAGAPLPLPPHFAAMLAGLPPLPPAAHLLPSSHYAAALNNVAGASPGSFHQPLKPEARRPKSDASIDSHQQLALLAGVAAGLLSFEEEEARAAAGAAPASFPQPPRVGFGAHSAFHALLTSSPLPARVFVLSIPVARGANWFLAGGGRRMDEEEATAAAAERIAAAAEDGTSLPVRLATDVVRFLYGGTGRREPADGGVVSASLLNAKPAVGGIGVEPRGGGVLRVLFTVASDAVADTVVRWRHELRRCVDSTAVFDVLSDREEAQHQALWPAFLAAKVAGKRAQFHRARLVVDGERVPAPAC
ncbi:hypothetical protein FOA52_015406 [Chlamydomonas sp. UWO 241]|nr:hypothetical protein FOA52_015406 [Chlamydomonas sp. UWO 241]